MILKQHLKPSPPHLFNIRISETNNMTITPISDSGQEKTCKIWSWLIISFFAQLLLSLFECNTMGSFKKNRDCPDIRAVIPICTVYHVYLMQASSFRACRFTHLPNCQKFTWFCLLTIWLFLQLCNKECVNPIILSPCVTLLQSCMKGKAK